ncbi:MAG TPA: SAM-dependent chlorinase/fluorinase [Polyangia bacterium]|nr:SAM-dependent chlorinase/fluorinase [Polyangia bacterium]
MAIVTFTTDFGFTDGYVAAMKGVVLALAPRTTLVDVAHGIAAQDVAAAAVALSQAAPLFPPGTIHVAVVDPGVGSPRAGLVVEAGGSFFIGPDNGVLSLAAHGPRRVFRIEAPDFRRSSVSPTFHGRDIFAPTAGRLAAGARASDAGPEMASMIELGAPTLRHLGDHVEGAVIHVDAFGNLITSIAGELVDSGIRRDGGDVEIELEGGEGRFHPVMARTFSDVEPNRLVAYIGSGGQLEIALRNGSAARLTGAARGSPVRMRGLS